MGYQSGLWFQHAWLSVWPFGFSMPWAISLAGWFQHAPTISLAVRFQHVLVLGCRLVAAGRQRSMGAADSSLMNRRCDEMPSTFYGRWAVSLLVRWGCRSNQPASSSIGVVGSPTLLSDHSRHHPRENNSALAMLPYPFGCFSFDALGRLCGFSLSISCVRFGLVRRRSPVACRFV